MSHSQSSTSSCWINIILIVIKIVVTKYLLPCHRHYYVRVSHAITLTLTKKPLTGWLFKIAVWNIYFHFWVTLKLPWYWCIPKGTSKYLNHLRPGQWCELHVRNNVTFTGISFQIFCIEDFRLHIFSIDLEEKNCW